MQKKPHTDQTALTCCLLAAVLCLPASVLWTPARAQTALVVSGSAHTESGTTHTTGTITNAGSYTGTGIRFTGALNVSGTSTFTVDTGTFAAITGTGASTLTLTSATASGAVNILGQSSLALNDSIFGNTMTIGGTSTGTLVNSRVANTTTVRENSSLFVSGGTLAAVISSSSALLDLTDAVTGNITFNNAAPSGTLVVRNSVVGTVSGSNLIDVSITGTANGAITMRETQSLAVGSGTFNAVNLYNTAATPGTLIVTSATTGVITGSNTVLTQITDSRTGNVIANNSAPGGTLAVENSVIGTVTGSNLANAIFSGGTASTLTLRETQNLSINSGSYAAINLYNTAATSGTLTITSATTGAITGSNAAFTQITAATTGNVTISNNAISGTLIVKNSAVGTVTGSNYLDVHISGGTIATASSGNGMNIGGASHLNMQDTVVVSHGQGINISGTSLGSLENVSITTQNNNAYGINLATSSTVVMTDGTITTRATGARGILGAGESHVILQNTVINSYGEGINLSGTSSGSLGNVNITTQSNNAHGINLAASSTVIANGGAITTSTTGARGVTAAGESHVVMQGTVINSYGEGINLSGTSDGFLQNVDITTQAANAHGINLAASSTIIANGGVITTSTTGARGVTAAGESYVAMQDTVINSYGEGINLSGTSASILDNVNITTKNTSAHGISLATSSTATVTGGTITTSAANARGISAGGESQVTLQDTVINSYGEGVNLSGTSVFVSYGVGITAQNGAGLNLATSSTATIIGGTITTVLGGIGITVGGSSSIVVQDTVIDSYSDGVSLSGTSTSATLNRVAITVSDSNSHGVMAHNGASVALESGTISASGFNGHGLLVQGGNAHATANNMTFFSVQSVGVYVTGGSADITNSRVVSNGSVGNITAIRINSAGVLRMDNVTVESALAGVISENRGTLIFTNGRFDVASTALVAAGGSQFEVVNSVINAGDHGASIQYNTNYTATSSRIHISGGTLTAGGYAFVWTDGPNSNGTIEVDNGTVISASTGLLYIGSPDNYLKSIQTSTLSLTDVDTSGVTGGISFGPETTMLAGDMTVNLSNVTGGINGDIVNPTGVMLNVNLERSQMTGNVIGSGTSTTTINLDNSTFTGATDISDDAILNLSLANNSTWRMTGKSKLTTLRGSNGATINIPVVFGDDLTVTGSISGQTNLVIDSIDTSVQDQQEIRVVVGEGAAAGSDAFTLIRKVPGGLYDYSLANRSADAWLVNSGISDDGAVVNSSAALQQALWFAQQDSLLKRMGDLRFRATTSTPSLNADSRSRGNLWLRGYALQFNARPELAGRAYTQYIHGVDIGADKAWTLADGSTLFTGIFIGQGRSNVDFKIAGAPGSELTATEGGLYATRLRQDGLYIDAALKAASVDHNLKTSGMEAGFTNLNLGVSVEIGKKYPLAGAWAGWQIEPQAQLGYVRLFAKNYTAGAMRINAQASDVLQLRASYVISRPVAMRRGGALQPYFKIGGAYVEDFGGAKIRNGGQQIVSKVEGMIAEGGIGVVWQLTAAQQLHFDYEASYAEKYNKPWGVNLGYRWQF